MDAEFRLVDSFDIDNGELDPYEKHECFVLGCEWQKVISEVDRNKTRPLDFTIHAANKDRIQAAMKRRNRSVQWKWPSDDRSEEWLYLHVQPQDS